MTALNQWQNVCNKYLCCQVISLSNDCEQTTLPKPIILLSDGGTGIFTYDITVFVVCPSVIIIVQFYTSKDMLLFVLRFRCKLYHVLILIMLNQSLNPWNQRSMKRLKQWPWHDTVMKCAFWVICQLFVTFWWSKLWPCEILYVSRYLQQCFT